MNGERGGKGIDLFKEAEMSSIPSSEFINEKDDLVGEFDASTCSGDHFYDIFESDEEIITEESIVWVNTNKTIWVGRVIKILFVYFLEDSKHLKLIWINKKGKIGFYWNFFQRIQTQKDSYINSEIQGWRGYGEISVGYYRQCETSETGIDNIRCKKY